MNTEFPNVVDGRAVVKVNMNVKFDSDFFKRLEVGESFNLHTPDVEIDGVIVWFKICTNWLCAEYSPGSYLVHLGIVRK